MSTVKAEITALEERLRLAELGPDPEFFQEALSDDAVMVSQDGVSFAKPQVVAAHNPGNGPKFTHVEMSDVNILDHGTAAVVTCKGTYKGTMGEIKLKFMRVWLKKNGRWQIVAGAVSNS